MSITREDRLELALERIADHEAQPALIAQIALGMQPTSARVARPEIHVQLPTVMIGASS